MLCLALLTTLSATAAADEVRLYRIVGSELELYRRIDSAVDIQGPLWSLDQETTAILREEGLFDIHPEDVGDDTRRPRSRGDGFLWDDKRSRWFGLKDAITLAAIDPNDPDSELRTLHAFDIDYEAWSILHFTNDPDLFYAVFLDLIAGEHRPLIARIEFSEVDRPDVQIWEMAASKVSVSEASYWIVNVAPDGAILSAAADGEGYKVWEFGVDEPVRSLRVPDRDPYGIWVASSPNAQTLAVTDLSEGGFIDLWRVPEETPYLTLPLHDYRTWSGGLASFTPDGKFLWCLPALQSDVRVWRCEDWVEVDEYQFAEGTAPSAFPGFAEWIIVGKDAPLEPEPSEWYQRGLYQAERSQPPEPGSQGSGSYACGGSSVTALLILLALVERVASRGRQRRHVAEMQRTLQEDR